jgi:hypothetical protein
MKKTAFILLITLFLALPALADEKEKTSTTSEPEEEASPAQVNPDDFIIINGSSNDMNTFVVINFKEKTAYTYNAYANGHERWSSQDLTELDYDIERQRAKNRKRRKR